MRNQHLPWSKAFENMLGVSLLSVIAFMIYVLTHTNSMTVQDSLTLLAFSIMCIIAIGAITLALEKLEERAHNVTLYFLHREMDGILANVVADSKLTRFNSNNNF